MNKQETFDFLGITKFWDAGYTGKNVRIMSDEAIIENYENTDKWHNVICPAGYQSEGGSWHGSAVMNILQDVCPDATYYAYPFSGSFTSNSYKCNCADYIIENNIHLFTTSCVGGKANGGKEKALQDCIDNGCTFFALAGNSGENGLWEESKSDKYITIGAVDDKLKWLNYSSTGEAIDYTMIAMYGTGTSYTTPTFCAMCGLVQDFFIVNAGRALKRDELIKFIDDNLIDIEEEGFDVKTGKGLFILPEPSSIDIGKYVPEYKGSDEMLFIDESKYEIKSPYIMNAEFIVVHNTANDASAKNEVSYMLSNPEKVSFHIAVDDKEVIQAIPLDRNAFHAGDGVNGEGNRKGIGIEICYSKSGGERFEKAKSNAIELITDILIERKWDITHVKKHQDFSGKYCPHRILDEGWDKFINRIQKRLEAKLMNEPSEWAKEAWDWGVANKICDGTNPKGTITREQVVQMMYNFFVKGGK
jgi:hypothetical protein